MAKGKLLTVLFEDRGETYALDIENGEKFDEIKNKNLRAELREVVGKNAIRILHEDRNMEAGEEETVIAMQLTSKLAWRGGKAYTLYLTDEGMSPFDDDYIKSHLSQEDYNEYKRITDEAVEEVTQVLGKYYDQVIHYVVNIDEE